MVTLDDIATFLSERNYDLRITGNARWIDQKCTPDVVWSIADFVLNYVDDVEDEFSVRDIWGSEYAQETIRETYSKPETTDESARHEYDKVFAQPLAMFAYAGIIEDISQNKRHLYVIREREILEYIGRNDLNALKFLCCYIEKVMADSGLMGVFDSFFERQDAMRFNGMKNAFVEFYHTYTPVQEDYEPKRIFTKVLNPLAYSRQRKGTEKGHMSDNIITRADMMYNRDNFRDVYADKPRNISRGDWLAMHPEFDVRPGYFNQVMNCNKRTLRRFNDEERNRISEWTRFAADENDTGHATQVHHIFPRSEFDEIKFYMENLIVLTPNQHLTLAHPDNNTQVVDPGTQRSLLEAKTCSIRYNLTSDEEDVYEFRNLLYVLSVGWGRDDVLGIDNGDYNAVFNSIAEYYNQ